MSNRTIAFTVENELCISCGVCKGICPQNCIDWILRAGMYFPKIDAVDCTQCGLCSRVCPGLGMIFDPADTPEKSMEGQVIECFNAWSLNSQKRHCSASGGVLSTLIPSLLEQRLYDGVFCLDSYDYRDQLCSQYKSIHEFSGDWTSNKIPKSRYLPVSHEKVVEYIRRYPDKRLILVGTSCAIQGLTKAIKQLHRDRKQYLLIGLFCDKVFTYNVMAYYQQECFCGEKELFELHFKNKESGGWPGNMKFHFSDGSSCYHDKSNRADMKEYFMPERCLYCIDKLNIWADISLGDNYTGIDESPLGSNSVILRTEQGVAAWHAVSDILETRPISIRDIGRAQALAWRANNAQYALVKQRKVAGIELNQGIFVEENPRLMAGHKILLARLNAGQVYLNDAAELKKQMKLSKRISLRRKARNFLSGCYHFLCRQLN